MTHPAPTAAPKTCPLRLNWPGTEVGGHPCRPRRVRYSAPFLALTFLTTTLSAQIIPTGTPAADILLSQAIAEHRVFLTCSALDPATHQQILTNWQRDTAAAIAILKAHNVPPEAITAFTTASEPAALTPQDDTPWADVKALCDTHPDWQASYDQFNAIVLELKLPAAFQ